MVVKPVVIIIFLFLIHADLALDISQNSPEDVIPIECSEILKDFAQYASNLTMCSLKNARPIHVCEKCIVNYVQFKSKYSDLSTTIVNGSSCLSMYISHDRLNTIQVYHANILSVWNKGNCNDCFTWTSQGPIISNKIKEFNKLFNSTLDCIREHWKPNNTEETCEKCMQSYTSLDSLYRSLTPDAAGIDHICMDIVDAMNTTRFIWSKTLNCCKLRRSPEVIFLCCTGVISFLPILFYLSVRFCGPIRDLPNVLKQTRFGSKFSRSDRDKSTTSEESNRDKLLTPGESERDMLITPEESDRDKLTTPEKSYRDKLLTPGESGRDMLITPEESDRDKLTTPEKSYRDKLLTPGESGRDMLITPEESDRDTFTTPREIGRAKFITPEESDRDKLITPGEIGRARFITPEESDRDKLITPEECDRDK